MAQGPVEPEEPGFIQFLDYIDRHWSWRTISGVASFIGDPFSEESLRGRLTRDSARDLLAPVPRRGISHHGQGPNGRRESAAEPGASVVLAALTSSRLSKLSLFLMATVLVTGASGALGARSSATWSPGAQGACALPPC
jgi:hypothetical protein